jgi:hypothetical protein
MTNLTIKSRHAFLPESMKRKKGKGKGKEKGDVPHLIQRLIEGKRKIGYESNMQWLWSLRPGHGQEY